jgi:CelD/BcsL family acetyltransferase involved in cellulose biosynthesis
LRPAVHSPAELSEAQLGAWSRLAERACEPNPFFEPAFVRAAVRHLEGGAEVRLLVAEDGSGDWRGCVPVRASRRWRRVPLPSISSWVHPYCFLGTPLMDREDPPGAARALLEAAGLMRRSALFGVSLAGSGPVLAALEAASAELGRNALPYESFRRAALRRRSDGDYVALSRKHEREVARMRRRLSELLGDELTVTDRASEDSAIEEFLRIERGGWKGEEGTAFASIPGHADLFREVCRSFADAGRLWLLSLQASGRAVAMKCNLLAGEEVFCFKIAFDEEYARFSPGIQLEVENADYFQQSPGSNLMDSCALPNNEMINRLWKGRREIAAVALPMGGALGALASPGVRLARRAGRVQGGSA